MAAEPDDDEEILSKLIPQSDSDNIDESRDHIIKKPTVNPVLICQTGYNSPAIVHSVEKFPLKKDRYNEKIGCNWKNGI